MTTNSWIAIDAMGGDEGLAVMLAGVTEARRRFDGTHFFLVGDEAKIAEGLKNHPNLTANSEIVHAPEVIKGDEKPSAALRRAKTTSMGVAIDLVKQGRAAAAVSSGNTGALMAMAKVSLRTMKGIDRPALAGLMPSLGANDTVVAGTGDDLLVVKCADDSGVWTTDFAADSSGYSGWLNGLGSNDLTFSGVDRFRIINTGTGGDIIYTGAGADTIQTGAGDDSISSGRGADVISGGAGVDYWIADRSYVTDAIKVDLTSTKVQAVGGNQFYPLRLNAATKPDTYERKLTFFTTYNGAGSRLGEKDWNETLNAFIDKIKSNGDLEKIYQKWMGASVPKFPDSIEGIPYTVQ